MKGDFGRAGISDACDKKGGGETRQPNLREGR